jgi:ABC-type sugar transport system permease subunit
MSYQYAFQWYQMGTGVAEAIVLLVMVVASSYVLLRLWHRSEENAVQ